MIVIPAIDLRQGQCVRLLRGNFDQCTTYSKTPVDLAKSYEQLGFTELHVVDLDGALTGDQKNQRVVEGICSATDLKIQLGGGIRTETAVASWINTGIARCVIGSIAVTDPVKVQSWIRKFGAGQIVLALDVREIDGARCLATHGWTRDTKQNLWECVASYDAVGSKHVLCTDIARDGAMNGPSVSLYADFVERFPNQLIQASGGVRSIEDLKLLESARVSAAIVGRALLDGCIDERELSSFLLAA